MFLALAQVTYGQRTGNFTSGRRNVGDVRAPGRQSLLFRIQGKVTSSTSHSERWSLTSAKSLRTPLRP